MKIIEKKLKKNILEDKKQELKDYFINFTFEKKDEKATTTKDIQIPKYLYKISLKKEFTNDLIVKFPLIINKNLKEKYNLFINDKLRYVTPIFYKLNANKFSDNQNVLFNKIINITYPIKKICKIIFTQKGPLV